MTGGKPARPDQPPPFCSQALPGRARLHVQEARPATSGPPAAVCSLAFKKLPPLEKEALVPQNKPITPTLQVQGGNARSGAGKVPAPSSAAGRFNSELKTDSDAGTLAPVPLPRHWQPSLSISVVFRYSQLLRDNAWRKENQHELYVEALAPKHKPRREFSDGHRPLACRISPPARSGLSCPGRGCPTAPGFLGGGTVWRAL